MKINYSTRELQAAAEALAAGHFRSASSSDPPARPTPCGRAAAWSPRDTHVVTVAAAHAGAGASTVALALADAAAPAEPVRLLDAAAPPWSAMSAATSSELGATDGWRRGRRGSGLVIDRVAVEASTPGHVPVPRVDANCALTVVDLGWSTRELASHPSSWLASTLAASSCVLVCRPVVSGLRQLEVTAGLLDQPPAAVVVLGASKWTETTFLDAGPTLRAARAENRIVFVPDPGRSGGAALDDAPLPKSLLRAGSQLLALLNNIRSAATETVDLEREIAS